VEYAFWRAPTTGVRWTTEGREKNRSGHLCSTELFAKRRAGDYKPQESRLSGDLTGQPAKSGCRLTLGYRRVRSTWPQICAAGSRADGKRTKEEVRWSAQWAALFGKA